jgi:acid phosphatase type 7
MTARGVIAGVLLLGGLTGLGAVSAATFAEGTSSPPPPPTPIHLHTKDPVLVGAGDIASVPSGRRGEDEATAELIGRILRQNRGHVTVFAAGDDAYESGTSSEFGDEYAPTWGRFRAITKPAPGNHEYRTSSASGYFGYFHVPPYYAFGRGSWRIYSLNSEVPHERGSAQERWLRRDLRAHPRRCVLAYWHRPRYSSGPHGSDASLKPLWNALADHRADVVVAGHDHDYERFASRQGIREFVVGTGGRSLYPFLITESGSVVRNSSTYGVIAFTLHRASYDFQFIPAAGGSFRDRGRFRCR